MLPVITTTNLAVKYMHSVAFHMIHCVYADNMIQGYTVNGVMCTAWQDMHLSCLLNFHIYQTNIYLYATLLSGLPYVVSKP